MAREIGDKSTKGTRDSDKPSTKLDQLEQISKISAPIMIPIVIALIGFFGNEILNTRQAAVEAGKLKLEYVKIAKEILEKTTPKTDPRIVEWAYKTFFDSASVKPNPIDVKGLSTDRVPLPKTSSLEINNIPEADVDRAVRTQQELGATRVEKVRQPDGQYTIRVTFPN